MAAERSSLINSCTPGDIPMAISAKKVAAIISLRRVPRAISLKKLKLQDSWLIKDYKITLKDEAGDVRTPDGYVFSAGFEQSSPKGDSVNNFKNCLEHARDKPGATAAVVYMKDAGHTKATIKAGIEKYRQHNSKPLRVYVVTKDGRIHRWDTHK